MPIDTSPARGRTPAEVGKPLRISPDRVRAMIARGELEAIATAPATHIRRLQGWNGG